MFEEVERARGVGPSYEDIVGISMAGDAGDAVWDSRSRTRAEVPQQHKAEAVVPSGAQPDVSGSAILVSSLQRLYSIMKLRRRISAVLVSAPSASVVGAAAAAA